MKLPKRIIKKYGITKKAWSVFRSERRSPSKRSHARVRPRSIKTRRVSYMVKKKSAKKTTRKKGFRSMAKYLGAGLYGMGRERLSNAIAPLTARIPTGSVADEVGMLAVLWAGKKFIGNKVPMVKDVANAGMLIESARIGEAIAKGQISLGGGSGSTGSNGTQIIG